MLDCSASVIHPEELIDLAAAKRPMPKSNIKPNLLSLYFRVGGMSQGSS